MEKRTVFFSVVIPSYNRPEMALRALRSVCAQTFTDYEVLVVNDGSVMDYSEVERECEKREHWRYFSKPNNGPSGTRNFGIREAKGKFICFLDDDDEYLPGHLQTLYDLVMKYGAVPGLYKTRTFIRTPDELKKQEFGEKGVNASPIEKVFSNIFGTCNVAVDSRILEKHNFRVGIPISEDFDLWSRIALEYPVFESPEYTTVYDFHGNNASMGNVELNHQKHIRAFRMTFATPGLKKKLPAKYWAGILSNRYLWLSAEQKRKGKAVTAFRSRVISAYYKLISILGRNKPSAN